MTGSLDALGADLTLAEAAEAARAADFDRAVRLLEGLNGGGLAWGGERVENGSGAAGPVPPGRGGGSAGGGSLSDGRGAAASVSGGGGRAGDVSGGSVPDGRGAAARGSAAASAPSGDGTTPGGWRGGEVARLDLLARVQAQAGNLDVADAAWARVLELAPGEPSAVAGRRRVARVRSAWGRRRRLPWRAFAVGAAVLVVAGGVVVLAVPSGPAPAVVSGSAAGAAPNGAAPNGAAASLQSELDRLNAAKSRDAAAATARRERLAALATALGAPGAVASAGETDVSVSFDAGLFGPDATSPSPQGRQALQQWAGVLKGQSVRVTVLGHGVTVAGGPATGGSTIALARATAAARVLATASGLPLTAFAIGSADQSTAAHPNAAPGANRTVTLLVTPA